jgi:hypothetical protein
VKNTLVVAVVGVAGVVGTFDLQGCTAPQARTRAVAEPVAHAKADHPLIDVVCIGNQRDSCGTLDRDLQQPARETLEVCDELALNPLFHVVPGPPNLAPTRLEVDQAFARLAAARGRLVIYTGHAFEAGQRCGDASPVPDAGVDLLLPFGGPGSTADMVAVRELLAGWSSTGDGGIRSANGWTVVVLNTCSSGMADVQRLEGALAVLGSGYSNVTAQGARPAGARRRFYSLFLELLAEALRGTADRPRRGNGDRAITDEEVADFLNARLADLQYGAFSGASTNGSSRELLAEQPVAVLRRQADVALPLGFLAGNEAAVASELDAGVPSHPATAMETGRQLLPGWVVESPARILLLDASVPAELVGPLRELGNSLDLQIVATGGEGVSVDAGRKFAFQRAYRLHMQASTGGTIFVSLIRIADGAFAWADTVSGKIPLGELAGEIARHVPPRWRLYKMSQQGIRSPLLAVQTDGRVQTGRLRVASWKAFLRGEATWRDFSVEQATLIPCPGAQGQCYLFAQEARPPVPSDDASDWLLQEVRR